MGKFKRITSRDGLEDVVKLGFNSGFDWGKEFDKASVVGLYENDELLGLVSFEYNYTEAYLNVLLIEVAKPVRGSGYGGQLMSMMVLESFTKPGFDGYIALFSKWNGIERFYMHLQAESFGQQMLFNPTAGQRLIDKYLPNGGKIE